MTTISLAACLPLLLYLDDAKPEFRSTSVIKGADPAFDNTTTGPRLRKLAEAGFAERLKHSRTHVEYRITKEGEKRAAEERKNPTPVPRPYRKKKKSDPTPEPRALNLSQSAAAVQDSIAALLAENDRLRGELAKIHNMTGALLNGD